MRDIDTLTLGELYQRGDYHLPMSDIPELPQASPRDRAFVASLESIRERARDVRDQPLRALYRNAGESEESR
jgi:hypothetical protein